MKRRRLKPAKFLRAAEILQKELDSGIRGLRYSCCCRLLGYFSKEQNLFSKLFQPTDKDAGEYWFGGPTKYEDLCYKPNVKNQERRIQAMLLCYEVAKRVR